MFLIYFHVDSLRGEVLKLYETTWLTGVSANNLNITLRIQDSKYNEHMNFEASTRTLHIIYINLIDSLPRVSKSKEIPRLSLVAIKCYG